MKKLSKPALSVKQYLEKNLPIPLKTLRHLSNANTAALLMELEEPQRKQLFQELLKAKLAPSILSEMPEPHIKDFIQNLSQKAQIALFSQGQTDDIIYLMDFVENRETLLSWLPKEQEEKIRKFMNYPPDTAGRLMQDDFFAVPPDFTALQAVEKLRDYSRERFVHYVYCVDEGQKLLGVLSIRQLAITPPQTLIKEVMVSPVVTVRHEKTAKEVSQIVDYHNFIALPVVNEDKKLLGLITVDDILDVIKDQATADIYARAGLPEDDRIYTKPLASIRHRMPWLLLNLMFALLASSIISLFEQTMSRLIILASLKNIVAGIGGNVGIQTLTVTARGLDTGDFSFTTFSKALIKEGIVGLVMGSAIGFMAAVVTFFWKGSLLVSLVIFLAMLLNSLIAVFSGFIIPVGLRKFNADPAVGSGALVTIITDIFGFLIFLGVASLGLQFLGESL